MSGNRFADCETVEHVLRSLLPIEPPEVWDALEADVLTINALARIAELTRPVVDEAARERAISTVRQWFSDPNSAEFAQLVDRIIADLGYKLIYSDDDHHPASAPAVELDADDLRLLAEWLTKWSDVALHLGVDIDHRLPIGYGCIRNRDTDGAWVLRIGGGE